MEPNNSTLHTAILELHAKFDAVLAAAQQLTEANCVRPTQNPMVENLYLLTRLGETLPGLVSTNLLTQEKAQELIAIALQAPQPTLDGADEVAAVNG